MTPESTQEIGSLDGQGAADHDVSFKFGRIPHVETPFPFSTRQFARLLVLRGHIADGVFGLDDLSAA
ncbi:MAG: hypothetical protein JO020_27310 [Chloroflexi bacterium]|nr:hypothetical protein [Chloroflexota bacterium]MBV9897883.1 hypothetical protein [Chloroflexota bacterium]